MENLRKKNQTEILEIKVHFVKQKTQWKATPAYCNKWKTETQSSKIKYKLKKKQKNPWSINSRAVKGI
jgi:hypothetical protein